VSREEEGGPCVLEEANGGKVAGGNARAEVEKKSRVFFTGYFRTQSRVGLFFRVAIAWGAQKQWGKKAERCGKA